MLVKEKNIYIPASLHRERGRDRGMGLKGTGSGKRHIARGAIFKVDDTLGREERW